MQFYSTYAQKLIKSAEFRAFMATVIFSCAISGETQNPKLLKFTYLVTIIVSQWCYLGKK